MLLCPRNPIDGAHNDDIMVLDINRNAGAGNLCVDGGDCVGDEVSKGWRRAGQSSSNSGVTHC